jgi:hypothetical protein
MCDRKKYWLFSIALLFACTIAIGVSRPALAITNLLTNGDFQACSTTPSQFPNLDLDVTNSSTLNQWLDLVQWKCVSTGGGNKAAQHFLAGSGNGTTDQLFQGILTAGTCIADGWVLRLRFSYINQGSNPDSQVLKPEVVVLGFGPAGTWSRFAPWPTNDASTELDEFLDNTGTSPVSESFPVPLDGDFTAIGVGFRFGFQGAATINRPELVDNVALAVDTFPATVNIDPDTLNLGSNGRWITAAISLPSCYSVDDINASTVRLTSFKSDSTSHSFSPLIVAVHPEIDDGVLEVKFDRSDVEDQLGALLTPPASVMLTLRGALNDGTRFVASGTISVINPGP